MSLRELAVQWLRDGNEEQAASILERCDVFEHYVDIGFELDSERMFTIIDVEISVTRPDMTLISQKGNKVSSQIEDALRQVSGSELVIRRFYWSGKATIPRSPVDQAVAEALSTVDSEHVRIAWKKAMDRRESDPEGAITAARTLLESVCKFILDENGIPYNDKDDLPKLYATGARELNLAPSQHPEQVFRQILGGCHAVVEGLSALRNRLGDAHGKGKAVPRPDSRYAELAVNLAGAIATFIVETWSESAT